MSKIKIENALKKYGDHTVIFSLDLDIKDGELFTVLGPSGCGKTTLLRMIAGFNSIEGGDFYFNDQRINDMEPSMRNIGMVFQNYAIFPHMSVRQNVEFGLKQRKLNRDEITERADRFLKLMQIEEYADRMPENLSGGQQQRIALARALVIEPDVLLMDEPLSNLDAKLRLEMREVIRSIQKNVGITTVYVTHDQEEAMAISDTIAVMDHGVLQQIASPKEIYHRPSNVFVATFIGRVNIMEGSYDHDKRILKLQGGFEMTYEGHFDSQNVLIAIRPEEFEISQKAEGLHGVVEDAVFLGLNTHYHLRLDNGERIEVIKVSSMNENYMLGEDVYLKILSEKINLFNEDGSVNLLIRS